MARLAQWTYNLRELVIRKLMRFLLPELLEGTAREQQANAFGNDASQCALPPHVLVEDNGAPVTVFSFASTMLLFASQPTFEFRGFFDKCGTPCNLVFFRDIHRFSYHLAPDESRAGLAFYEQEVRHYMKALGATTHIALGDSSGGSAALYFGAKCGMDKVIALSPAFPLRTWFKPWVVCQYLFNLKRMITAWPEYREMGVVVFSNPIFLFDIVSRVGFNGLWDPMGVFRAAQPRPEATIFYGAHSPGDSENAHRIADLPGVKLVPLPTSRHSIGVFMARRGMLQRALLDEVESFLAAQRQPSNSPPNQPTT